MTQFGLSQTQIAEEYNRSQGWVAKRLALLPEEQKPAKKPELGGRPSLGEVIPRGITSPKLAAELRSAPAETQAAVAKAVEEHNLSTRKTKALADALKQVEPAKRQEVAKIAAASPRTCCCGSGRSPVVHGRWLVHLVETVPCVAYRPDVVLDVFEVRL